MSGQELDVGFRGREDGISCHVARERYLEMRIGVAGVGRIGAFHAETLRDLGEIDSLVVADAQPERAKHVADTLGVAWARDIDELLSTGLDGLVIGAAT